MGSRGGAFHLAIGSGVRRSIVVTIESGSDLLETLEEVAKRESLKNAAVLSGVGSLNKASFRNIETTPGRGADAGSQLLTKGPRMTLRNLSGPMEIISLEGNITRDDNDRSVLHLHGMVSDEEARVFGGALSRGCEVSRQVEVFILEMGGVELRRVLSPETGSKNLVPTVSLKRG